MARSESRTKVSIWSDDDFRALTKDAQRAYWMLYSQPTITLCGVLAWTPGRWAILARDETTEDVVAAVEELEVAGFVIFDRTTEELWVRSFILHDGVTRSPKTLASARLQLGMIASATIRKGVMAVFDRLANGGDLNALGNGVSDGVSHTVPNGVADTHADRPRVRAHAVSVSSLQSPSPRTPDLNGDSGGIAPALASLPADREESGPFEDAFDALWPIYPRRVGRKAALRAYVATRRRGADPVELERAVKHYAAAVRGRAPDKVKHGSTFFGPDEPWTDYVTGVPASDSPLPPAVGDSGARVTDPPRTW